jgi:hypothetical protein
MRPENDDFVLVVAPGFMRAGADLKVGRDGVSRASAWLVGICSGSVAFGLITAKGLNGRTAVFLATTLATSVRDQTPVSVL